MTNERTRFAPSPTGKLHIGNLRTALYAYFLAKQTGGKFLVRIEDTDQNRKVENGIEETIGTIGKLGIQIDEGVMIENGKVIEKGEKGPYQQSHRLNIYRKYATELLKNGHAYHCFCSKDRLTELRTKQQEEKKQPRYDRKCLELTDEEVENALASGKEYVIRLKVPEGETVIEDIIRGKVTFKNKEIDDQVLVKADGFPTYHLAVVVDDHLMEISTVIRGIEWLTSAPKHVILYKMLGWELPKFAHLPLLLNSDKSKLSKRQGDVAAENYLDKGYLPETIINFIATLGYNPTGDREIYSEEELIKLFDLAKVKKSGAVVNFEKLDWMNKQYIKKATVETLKEKLEPFTREHLQHADRQIEVEKTRATTLVELAESLQEYKTLPNYETHILVWKKSNANTALDMLKKASIYLENANTNNLEQIEKEMKEYISKEEIKTGEILWPLRVALSGKERSPSPFELIYALDKEESLNRIQTAITKLKT